MLNQELVSELAEILKTDYGLSTNHEETLRVGEFLKSYFDLLSKIKNPERRHDETNQLSS